jgi:hypothetical protein
LDVAAPGYVSIMVTELAGGIVIGFVGAVVPALVYVNVMFKYPAVLLRNTQYALKSVAHPTAGMVMALRAEVVIL